MRYALISCIHGNLAAFQAVLLDAEQLRCDSMLCLGDIVGYFDQPAECLDLVRSQCKASVKGNYDEYCSELYSLDDFSPSAAKKIDWTRQKLSVSDRAWLSELPYQLDTGDFSIVHASLCSPNRWNYVFDKVAAGKHFDHQTASLCFNGHTHVPVVFKFDTHGVNGGTYTRFTTDPNIKYLVNVGSVGQPRDGNPSAAYVVYDAASREVELRRVDYLRPPLDGHSADKPVPGAGGSPRTLLGKSNYGP